jgi:hypothetical protein
VDVHRRAVRLLVLDQADRVLLLHYPLSAFEREALVEQRWWTLAELRGSAETFSPPRLAELVAQAGGHAEGQPC